MKWLFGYTICFLLACTQLTTAQRLLKDINQQGYGSNPRYLTRVANRVFFQARDVDHGTELWITDGTSGGTHLVKDIVLGEGYSAPQRLESLGDKVIFATYDPKAVWVSDGTEAGTLVLHDFESSLYSGSGGIQTMIQLGGRIFFSYYLGRSIELWATDGTPEGTIRIHAETKADQYAVELTAFHDSLYFVTYVPGDPSTVWRMHPQESVPEKFLTSDIVNAGRLYTDDERLYMMAGTVGDFPHLWVSDGTVSGTEYLRFIGGAPHAEDGGFFGSLGDRVLFFAKDGVHGFEPWVSDGTVAGTFMLADTNPGEAGTTIYGESARVGNQVFFLGNNEAVGYELWVTDGTSAGTHLTADIYPGPANSYPEYFSVVDDRFLFRASDGVHGDELWTSDGTAEGTTMLVDFNAGGGSGDPGPAIAFLDGFLLGASDGEHGRELWLSDGTPAGSRMIKDLALGGTAQSWISNLVSFDGKIFFKADDGIIGNELWQTDGTQAGTRNVVDMFEGSNSASLQIYGVVNQKLLVGAKTGETGRILWVFSPDTDIPQPITSADNDTFIVDTGDKYIRTPIGLVFTAWDDLHGYEVWITDGSKSGTRRLTDAGPDDRKTNILGWVNDKVIFTRQDGVYSISDVGGNPQFLVGDLRNFPAPSSPAVNGKILFDRRSGQLHSTDGTVSGTRSLRSSVQFSGSFAKVGNLVFFKARDKASDEGFELWRSDGTEQGTFLVKDIFPGTADSDPYVIAAVENRLFFTADDGQHGRELWVSDGTESGTAIVSEITTGLGSTNIEPLLVVENRLLFSAYDEVHGNELWISDGTETGTFLLLDFLPGPESSRPQKAASFKDDILITFKHPDFGRELWKINLSALGVASEFLSVTPQGYSLRGNYPNPFNPSTTITYSLSQPSDIQLEIFDLLGKRVRVLENGFKPSGEYEIIFDATELATGVYFYTLTTGDFLQTRKMVLLR